MELIAKKSCWKSEVEKFKVHVEKWDTTMIGDEIAIDSVGYRSVFMMQKIAELTFWSF